MSLEYAPKEMACELQAMFKWHNTEPFFNTVITGVGLAFLIICIKGIRTTARLPHFKYNATRTWRAWLHGKEARARDALITARLLDASTDGHPVQCLRNCPTLGEEQSVRRRHIRKVATRHVDRKYDMSV
jgi:hypothetical protein